MHLQKMLSDISHLLDGGAVVTELPHHGVLSSTEEILRRIVCSDQLRSCQVAEILHFTHLVTSLAVASPLERGGRVVSLLRGLVRGESSPGLWGHELNEAVLQIPLDVGGRPTSLDEVGDGDPDCIVAVARV